MRLISIDSSTADLHLALAENGKMLSSEQIFARHERQYAASMLVPAIDHLMKQVQWQKKDIEAIVVGVGPGSFTGIRAAVVTARTLAQALCLPLIGISILDCYASQVTSPCIIVLNAGRQEFFLAAYDFAKSDQIDSSRTLLNKDNLKMECILPPGHFTANKLTSLPDHILEWLVEDNCLELLKSSLSNGNKILQALAKLNNVAAIQAEIAYYRLSVKMKRQLMSPLKETELSQLFAYSAVEPLYLRNASITIKETII